MKNNILKFYTIAFILCSIFTAFADPTATDGTGTLESPDAAPAPINDYLWILVLIGFIFAYKKITIVMAKKVPIS